MVQKGGACRDYGKSPRRRILHGRKRHNGSRGRGGVDTDGILERGHIRGAFLQKLVGFNSNSFDIPFLVRRSWKLGVSVPKSLFKVSYGRVRLNANCIDMLDFWSFGTRDSIKLRDLAKFLGVGEKTGDGADFSGLYESDGKSAIDYLRNDVLLTMRCARAIQLTK